MAAKLIPARVTYPCALAHFALQRCKLDAPLPAAGLLTLPNYKVFHEGDYSPVELAWCAYVTEEQYNDVLMEYPTLNAEIKEKTVTEDDHRIICYTQVLTDVPDFHRNMEKYEIYNGNLDKESFENVILDRFIKWNGEGQIFERSFFKILSKIKCCISCCRMMKFWIFIKD